MPGTQIRGKTSANVFPALGFAAIASGGLPEGYLIETANERAGCFAAKLSNT
jgi:hypothetical protein